MTPILLKSNRGFTLVEVIVALAILGIVVSTAFSFMGFSRRTLSVSNSQYDIQNDIRLASSYISSETRFATELSIVPYSDVSSGMNSHIAQYSYFYINDGALNQAKYINSATYEEHTYGSTISSELNKSFFQSVGTDTLRIMLTAESDGNSYDVITDINLENFLLSGQTIAGQSKDLAIRYKTQ